MKKQTAWIKSCAVAVVSATFAFPALAGVMATDGSVSYGLYPGGTEGDPAIFIIGETGPYVRDYGSTPLDVGYDREHIEGYSHIQLYIRNGSTVTSGDDSLIGAFYNEAHRLVRLTDASTWTVGGTLYCPSSGNDDKLEVFGGSLVSCSTLSIGGGATGDGEVVVSNANSRIVISGDILGGAINAYSEMTIVDHALLRVEGSSINIDYVNFNDGFLAWQGDHTSDNPLFTARGWDGAAWQSSLNVTKTYCATDAEAKLLTSDSDSGFAGYDNLGGYTLYTASIPGEGIIEVWSGLGDFTGDSNPNGEWSYGGTDGVFSNFTLGYFDGDRAWVLRGGNQTGWIWTNNMPTVQYGVAPGQLALHPAYDVSEPTDSAPAVLRWTAPAFGGTGRAHVVGNFYAGDGGAINNRVSHNSTSLWDQVTGEFDLVFDVVSGDTIDFIVYGSYNYANTPLDAFVELTYFEQSTNTLTVISEYGSPTPALGTNDVISGETITCSVEPVTIGSTSYSPTGWTLSGQEPASGTTNWFEMTSETNAVLTWNWQTNYWLDVNTTGSGSVDVSDGFYAKGSEQILTATPDSGWLFMGWSGNASGTNEALVMMTEPQAVTATFSDDADGDGLTNAEEDALGSNPWKSDTDGDGFGDKLEADHNWNPTVSDQWAIDYISANGDAFDLYSSNVVLDVAVGQILIETAGGNATLSLQLEESEDLVIWTNAGDAVEWVWPVDGEKEFFRVRSGK